MNRNDRIEQVRELVKEKLGSNNSLLAHEVDWVCSEAKRERASVERDMSELTRERIREIRTYFGDSDIADLCDMAIRKLDAEAENADLRQRLQETEHKLSTVDRYVDRLAGDREFYPVSVVEDLRAALAQSSETSGSGNDRFERATELIRTLVDNDPEDMAGDGITVFEAWRKEALRFLGRPCELCGDEGYITVDEQTGGRRINCPECEDTTRATTGEPPLREGAMRAAAGYESPHPTCDSQESGEALAALDALHGDATDGGFQPSPHADEQYEIIRQHLQRAEPAQESGEALAAVEGVNKLLETYVSTQDDAILAEQLIDDLRQHLQRVDERAEREEQAQAGVPESVLTKERKAIESAIRFVDERIVPRRCDIDGVSGCWRCQTVYLARTLERLLGEQSNG